MALYSTYYFRSLLIFMSLALIACSNGPGSFHVFGSNQENSECLVAKINQAPKTHKPSFSSKIDISVLESKVTRFGLSDEVELALLLDQKCLVKENRLASSKLKANTRNLFSVSVNASEVHLQDLIVDECVLRVEKNKKFYRFSSNDPRLSQQEHLTFIKWKSKFEDLFGQDSKLDQEVVIAIIDDGVDWLHEDLSDIMWANPTNGRSGYDFVRDTDLQMVRGDHGTHVAGLAAAHTGNNIGVAGVMAKNAKIMTLNVFPIEVNQPARMSDIVNAIYFAADNGADIINMSLGGEGRSEAIREALNYAVSKGVSIFMAAGNDGKKITNNGNENDFFITPAGYAKNIEGAISVGAINGSNGSLCSFSNYSNSYVQFAAPGCSGSSHDLKGVFSTLLSDNYGRGAGTSMASPIAAGIGAILHSYFHSVKGRKPSPAELETHLLNGSRSVASISTKVKSGKTTDLARLFTYMENNIKPEPVDPVNPEPTEPNCL